jgi:hypothetical protein
MSITSTSTREQDQALINASAQAVYASAKGSDFTQQSVRTRHEALLAAYAEKWGTGTRSGGGAANATKFPWQAYPTTVPSVTERD